MNTEEQKRNAPEGALSAEPESDGPKKPVRRANEGFGRVSVSALRELERGDLKLPEFALLSYIIVSIHHQTGELVASLRSLDDGTWWPWKEDNLRKNLMTLRDKEWIGYPSHQGKRKPYIITYGRKLQQALGSATAPTLSPTSAVEKRFQPKVAPLGSMVEPDAPSASASESVSGEQKFFQSSQTTANGAEVGSDDDIPF